MNTERWHRVEHLFQAALEREPGQRAAFLAEGSGGDEELRREVEAMLALGEQHRTFLERPAVEIALARDGMTTGRLRQAFESALARKAADSTGEFRLSPGTRLGPYEIVEPAGAGGMGEIYRAGDTRLGREVALKILAGRLLEQAGTRGRFEAEAQAISSLNHPNICTLYDIGRHEDVDYLVMEYLHGQTLAERLKQGPVPYAELLRVAVEVSGALAYAHARGVIHRDVKPSNIMLTTFGAKLLDFGLARWEREAEVLDAIPLTDSAFTVTGLILGTPQYMAPEQIERGEINARTDIFALGAVLFEMATGRKAFEGQSSAEVIRAILAGDGPKASSLRSAIPADLAEVIGICLKTRPEERWQSAGDLRDALTKLANPEGPLISPRLAKTARAFAIAAALLGVSVELGDHGLPLLQRVQFREDTKFEILRVFPSRDRRGTAPSGLMAGSRGVLYGTSAGGGETWSGTVFEMDPPLAAGAPWFYKPLYTFTGGADGANPEGGVIEGPGGKLYGTTSFGGAAGNGTVFELTPPVLAGGAWSEKVLHYFTRQGGDGCAPEGTLVFGKNGELYGTTRNGGIPGQGAGIVFQLTPPSTPRGQWTEKVLHTFTGPTDGANPVADLILDKAGALYGATGCDTPNAGLVFKLEPPAMPGGEWTETIVHRLTEKNGEGVCSTGGLYFGPDGALFGTSTRQFGHGSVFELQPPATPGGQWKATTLSVFTGQNGDGSDVVAGLAVGPDGAFYGTAAVGGRWGDGVIFELKPPAAPGGSWTKIVLYSLNAHTTGARAASLPHLVFEKGGTLYGAARESGPGPHGGTVFRLKF